MIDPLLYFKKLQDLGIDFFTGVPDSLLKHFCACVTENSSNGQHVIASNEGASIALAIGHHLATNQVPLVYLQNSGLGNTVNPLLSLADPEVYSTPIVLMIGWRGQPGVKDEPQHIKQGRVMLATLDAMEIPYAVVGQDEEQAWAVAEQAVRTAKRESRAFALIIEKNTFASFQPATTVAGTLPLKREEAIVEIASQLANDDIVVATTGMASRELFESRVASGQPHHQDFLTVGGMGHASQISLGIAQAKPSRRVMCIDGDGALIMHMGSLAISGQSGLDNFHHVVINNGAHDSVGGQPTVGMDIDITKVAQACGYKHVATARSIEELKMELPAFLAASGPNMLEINVSKGNRADLGRPTTTPLQNKQAFMAFLDG